MSTREDAEIDRLTARLRGYETNRGYWTRYSWTQPPFDVDEYMTGQVMLITRHVKESEGELVYPSLYVELWRACWNGSGDTAWKPYTEIAGDVFEKWLELPHLAVNAEKRANGGAYGHGNGLSTLPPLG